MDIFFSIIIPTFNRAQLIGETIASIVCQKDVSLEIVVVDDGGEDDTAVIVEKFHDDRIKYIRIENGERGAARNAGLRIASGRYVNYFDSDDTLNPILANLHEFIVVNNNPPVVFGSIEQVFQGRSLGIIKPHYRGFKASILHNNFLACGSVFVRSDIAGSFMFSEKRKLSGAEDWELWLRVYACHDFLDCKMPVFKQHEHPGRSLRNEDLNKFIDRELCFAETIQEEKSMLLKRFTVSEIKILLADRFSLIALFYCEHNVKDKALHFWINSAKTSFHVLRRKRFWAVARKLLLP